MSIIGEKFKNDEVFVSEVLVAARAMNAGAKILQPYLAEGDGSAKGLKAVADRVDTGATVSNMDLSLWQEDLWM